MNVSNYRYTYDRWRYAWFRYRHRGRVEELYARLVWRLDKQAFTENLRSFWDPFAGPGAAKFLNIDVWLRDAILRYLLVMEGLKPGGLVVDLGSGAGYFLWVCRELGHEVLGIDLPGEPLYDACFELLDLPRIEYRIEAERALGDHVGDNVNLIAAFMTCFDRYADGTAWDEKAWSFFLADARDHLAIDGCLALKFNADAQTGELYSREMQRLFRSTTGFRCRFFLDYVLLAAC